MSYLRIDDNMVQLDDASWGGGSNSSLSCYESLWAAFMRRVIQDYALYYRHREHRYARRGEEARIWLEDRRRTDLTGIVPLCEMLGLHPDAIQEEARRQLRIEANRDGRVCDVLKHVVALRPV